MRGALEPVSGVTKVDIAIGDANFKVTYDPAKVKLDDLLKKLEEAKEPAKNKGS